MRRVAYRGLTFSDPFGLCPEELGGDGQSNNLDDCPTDDPEKIRKVDSLTKVVVAEWKSAIRIAVATEVAAVGIAVARARVAAENLAVRTHLALINNPKASFAAGYSLAVGRGALQGTAGLPAPVLPTAAMKAGYLAGELTVKAAKLTATAASWF
jgi:hypothetical protein